MKSEQSPVAASLASQFSPQTKIPTFENGIDPNSLHQFKLMLILLKKCDRTNQVGVEVV